MEGRGEMLAKNGCDTVLKTAPAKQVEIAVNRMCRYLRVSRLLLSTFITAFICGCHFTDNLLSCLAAGPNNLWFSAFGAICCFSIACVAILDSRSRYQDYKRAKDLFFENGFHPRIAGLFLRSRCQRDAAFVAASDLGYQAQIHTFYRQKGCRWYHFLPDAVFKRPGLVISRKFWRYTLFSPAYKSRFFSW